MQEFYERTFFLSVNSSQILRFSSSEWLIIVIVGNIGHCFKIITFKKHFENTLTYCSFVQGYSLSEILSLIMGVN